MRDGLIPLRHLIDRMRKPRSRADEVRSIRERLVAQPDARALGEHGTEGREELGAARELLTLRLEISAAMGAVESCKTCAIGHPPPHGHFQGGHCCGLRTEDAFNDDELAALRQTGTCVSDLQSPRGDHAGCSFRGETGCSLRTENRPNLCLRYVCPDLARELHGRGVLDKVEAIGARMESVYLRFITLRRERLDAEEARAGLAPPVKRTP